MCGIIHIKRYDGRSARKMLNKRYQAQKERGKEGFGYVSIDDNFLVDYKKSMTEKVIMDFVDKESANEIMFHHRFPTSTPNLAECAHPIAVSHEENEYVYFVIHNGVIFNDFELKAEHEKLGYKYTTQIETITKCQNKEISTDIVWNDSEALAIELARDLDKGKAGIPGVRGSIAFIVLQADRKSQKAVKLFFGRNYQSPLQLDRVPHQYMAITSTGKGQLVEAHMLYTYDYEDDTITKTKYSVGSGGVYQYPESPSTYDYPYRDYPQDGHMETHKSKIGFSRLPLIGARQHPAETTFTREDDEALEQIAEDIKRDKQYDDYADDYWNLKEEYEDVVEILKNWIDKVDGTEEDKSWYEAEVIRLQADLLTYDDKSPVIITT